MQPQMNADERAPKQLMLFDRGDLRYLTGALFSDDRVYRYSLWRYWKVDTGECRWGQPDVSGVDL